MSVDHAQIFHFRKIRKCVLFPPSRSHKRGASRSSRTLGAGCGGRNGDARRAALKRTAKACGPDAPTLASRSRDYPANDGGKRARSPGRARISRKTIAQGMPADCGVPVVANACAFCCTRGRGCTAHPAFPAPSYFSRVIVSKTRTHRAARTRSCVLQMMLFENDSVGWAKALLRCAHHPAAASS